VPYFISSGNALHPTTARWRVSLKNLLREFTDHGTKDWGWYFALFGLCLLRGSPGADQPAFSLLYVWEMGGPRSGCLQGILDRRGRQSNSMVTQIVDMRESWMRWWPPEMRLTCHRRGGCSWWCWLDTETPNSFWSAMRMLMCMSSKFLLLGITTNFPNQANNLSYATVRYIHLQHNNPGLDSVLQVT